MKILMLFFVTFLLFGCSVKNSYDGLFDSSKWIEINKEGQQIESKF